MELAQQIAFVPQTATAQAAGQTAGPSSAARPDSIARFQTLMYAPEGTASAAATVNTPGAGAHMQGWLESVSSQWNGLDQSIQRMSSPNGLTPQELLSLQYQVLKASVSLELTSKSAGVVERDIQTLIQRN
jgi:hypothetical protein